MRHEADITFLSIVMDTKFPLDLGQAANISVMLHASIGMSTFHDLYDVE